MTKNIAILLIAMATLLLSIACSSNNPVALDPEPTIKNTAAATSANQQPPSNEATPQPTTPPTPRPQAFQPAAIATPQPPTELDQGKPTDSSASAPTPDTNSPPASDTVSHDPESSPNQGTSQANHINPQTTYIALQGPDWYPEMTFREDLGGYLPSLVNFGDTGQLAVPQYYRFKGLEDWQGSPNHQTHSLEGPSWTATKVPPKGLDELTKHCALLWPTGRPSYIGPGSDGWDKHCGHSEDLQTTTAKTFATLLATQAPELNVDDLTAYLATVCPKRRPSVDCYKEHVNQPVSVWRQADDVLEVTVFYVLKLPAESHNPVSLFAFTYYLRPGPKDYQPPEFVGEVCLWVVNSRIMGDDTPEDPTGCVPPATTSSS